MSSPARMPSPGRPRILVSGWAGAGNIGDELLTRTLVAALRDGGADVVVASRDPHATEIEHPGVDAVRWGLAGIRSMGRIDGVCVGPGGILQDSSSLWSLPGHLAMPWWARRRGAVVGAIGVGAEPLRSRVSGWMLRRVLGGASVVTRDAESSAALAAVGVVPTTAIDVVFGLTPPIVERGDEIVVSIGPSTAPGLFTPASRRLRPPPIDTVAEALDALAARTACRLVLTRFRGARDADVAAEIGARLSSDHELLGHDIDEHIERIAGARLVISSRYHPVVLAAVCATPAVVVSDQVKIISLVAQIDDPSIVRVPSWASVAAVEPGVAPGNPPVPAGIETVRSAVESLIRSARETRGER